jgi:hypothetical protein
MASLACLEKRLTVKNYLNQMKMVRVMREEQCLRSHQ